MAGSENPDGDGDGDDASLVSGSIPPRSRGQGLDADVANRTMDAELPSMPGRPLYAAPPCCCPPW